MTVILFLGIYPTEIRVLNLCSGQDMHKNVQGGFIPNSQKSRNNLNVTVRKEKIFLHPFIFYN